MAGIGSEAVTTPMATTIPMAILLMEPTTRMGMAVTQRMVTMVIPILMAATTMMVIRATIMTVDSTGRDTVPVHTVVGLGTTQEAKPAHVQREQMLEVDQATDPAQLVQWDMSVK